MVKGGSFPFQFNLAKNKFGIMNYVRNIEMYLYHMLSVIQ